MPIFPPINIEDLKAKLDSVGESIPRQELNEKFKEAMDKIDEVDFSALSPSALNATIDTVTDAIAEKKDVIIAKGQELAPKLESFTQKMVETINDPSLAANLQGLVDNLGIQPPGIGQLNLGGGLDIGTSALGNFDISSALSVANKKLEEVNFSGFDSVLPDINSAFSLGPLGGAGTVGKKIPGGIFDSLTDGINDSFGSVDKVPTELCQVGSGAFQNAFKTFGNIQIKDVIDEKGNMLKEVFAKGVPCMVPEFDARIEIPSPDVFVAKARDTTTKILPKLYETTEILQDKLKDLGPEIKEGIDKLTKEITDGGLADRVISDLKKEREALQKLLPQGSAPLPPLVDTVEV